MDLPAALKLKLDELACAEHTTTLKVHAQKVSDTYRFASRNGQRLVSDSSAILSYALTRMPATFAAVSAVAKELLAAGNALSDCHSLFDVGAGTGPATWALLNAGFAGSITCFEREDEMRRLGQKLMRDAYPDVAWQTFDLTRDKLPDSADIVIASYVLNELAEAHRLSAVDQLWQRTGRYLILVEPGTKAGFANIKQARGELIKSGAFVLAPCPCNESCPLPADDWCHFSCRLARSKIHKALKSADAPFEDEKFSYLIASRVPAPVSLKGCARVLRHPRIDKGKVELELCTPQGLVHQVITRKQSDLYKKARKLSAGDAWDEAK